MDKQIVSHIDAEMADVIVPGIETEQVARLKIRRIHMDTVGKRVIGDTAGLEAELTEDILNKSGAVKAGFGSFAAPFVRGALILQGISGDLFSELSAG